MYRSYCFCEKLAGYFLIIVKIWSYKMICILLLRLLTTGFKSPLRADTHTMHVRWTSSALWIVMLVMAEGVTSKVRYRSDGIHASPSVTTESNSISVSISQGMMSIAGNASSLLGRLLDIFFLTCNSSLHVFTCNIIIHAVRSFNLQRFLALQKWVL